jgi:hypothetical protein
MSEPAGPSGLPDDLGPDPAWDAVADQVAAVADGWPEELGGRGLTWPGTRAMCWPT